MPPRLLQFATGIYRERSIKYRKDHLIVKFKQHGFHTHQASSLLDSFLGSGNYALAGEPIGLWTYLEASVQPDKLLGIINDLDRHGEIEFAEPDLPLIASAEPNDPHLKSENPPWQWGPEYMGMYSAWDIHSGSDDVVIGLLDSGVPLPESPPVPPLPEYQNLKDHLEHEDMDGVRFIAGKNPLTGLYWPRDDYAPYHGTQMAGIMAAFQDNSVGIAGINWVSPVYVYKAVHGSYDGIPEGSELRSTGALVYYGIKEVTDYASSFSPAKRVVINLSLNYEDDFIEDFPTGKGTLLSALDHIHGEDAILCVAAGDVRGKVLDPGNFAGPTTSPYHKHVIVVGAVHSNDMCMESYAHDFDEMVYAPGVDVGTTSRSDAYVLGRGTSHATAHVSALVAVLWSESKHLGASSIVDILKSTCRFPDEADVEVMESYAYNPGRGIVQASHALQKMKTRVCLVLDKSGSMSASSGIGGKTRLEIMQTAASDLIDLVDTGSSLGIVSFNESADTVHLPTLIENLATRSAIETSINTLAAGGFTSIGAGVKEARDLLSPLDPPRAIIILTDGQENRSPYLSTMMEEDSDISVYAIGMGAPETLHPDSLVNLAEHTNGYVDLTEDFEDSDPNVLTKFLIQIVGEITGSGALLDPAKRILPGEKQEFPTLIGEADKSVDIIIIKPSHAPLGLEITSPSGKSWPEVREHVSTNGRVARYRISLPPCYFKNYERNFGEWRVEVSLPAEAYRAWLEDQDGDNPGEPVTVEESLAYSLAIHSRTSLRMRCRIKQTGFAPGSSMKLRVDLEDRGEPVDSKYTLDVGVTDPNNHRKVLKQDSGEGPGHNFTIIGSETGIYRWDIKAMSSPCAERPFQRECRLTGAIWSPRVVRGPRILFPRPPFSFNLRP